MGRRNNALSNDPLTDLELVQLVAKQDMGAFNELYSRYVTKARSLTYRTTLDMSCVDDVVQNAMITLWNKAHTFRGDSSFGSWFYRIVANESLQHLRKKKLKGRGLALTSDIEKQHRSSEDERCGPDQEELRLEAHSLLYACVYMPANYWESLYLMAIGYTAAEVAQRLDLTIPKVKSRVFRARAWMTKQFSKNNNRKFALSSKARIAYMKEIHATKTKGADEW